MSEELKVAHTPGPWKLETVRTSSGICHKIGEFPRGGKVTYACVYDDLTSPGNPESQALLSNARLMAIAPELLEYFNASTGWFNTAGHEDATVEDEQKAEARFDAATKAVRDAIARNAQ